MRSSSSTPATRRRPWLGRSSSCEDFGACTSRPASGERVTFRLAAEQFAYTGADYRRIVEPGLITLSVGTSSVERPLTAALELTGPTIELVVRDHFLTETTLD